MINMDYITWLELNDWQPFREGDRVIYSGSMLAAHGVWVVHAQIEDTRYTLRAPHDPFVRLNANREDLAREGNPVE